MKNLEVSNLVLVGNPNVGKTTTYNNLTTNAELVSNFAGTTVDSKKSTIQNPAGKSFELLDVPGIYGNVIETTEEKAAWKTIIDYQQTGKARFIQIVDGENIPQSLLLTLNLLAQNITPILVINNKNKHEVNAKNLNNIKKVLGLSVLVTDVEKTSFSADFWKFIEKNQQLDTKVTDKFKQSEKFKEIQASHKSKNDFIRQEICKVVNGSGAFNLTNKLDKFLLNRYLGIPIFLGIMYLVFEITFTWGSIPMDFIDSSIEHLQNWLVGVLPASLWTDLIVHGIIAGIGGLVIFLPNILILFVLLNILQESGYLSRVAFLLDRLFQKFGVTGKASVPLLMGFGCNVPAIMSTRNMQTRKEKIITSMMTLFMSCGARLPVLLILIAAFIQESRQSMVLFVIYFFGIFTAFLTGLLFNRSMKGEQPGWTLVMPNYSLPRLKKIRQGVQQKFIYFIKNVGKVLLPMTIVFWALFTFPQETVKEKGIEYSYGAMIGKTIEPIFSPMGFDWKISTAIVAGVAAKEIMVTSMAEIYSLSEEDEAGLIEQLQSNIDFPSAMALLVFTLLYMPCLAVIATMKTEFGWKWAIITVIYPTVVAWLFSFATYHLMKLI